MEQKPQTWHYGLVAKWWAEFRHDGPEIPYYQTIIRRFGEPALDVACGTGRVLIPALQAGLDVDGSDISGDMLALCREQAEQAGYSPNLYQPVNLTGGVIGKAYYRLLPVMPLFNNHQ